MKSNVADICRRGENLNIAEVGLPGRLAVPFKLCKHVCSFIGLTRVYFSISFSS